MDRYEQLERIKRLRDEGVLSETEFHIEKERILHGAPEPEAKGYAVPAGHDPRLQPSEAPERPWGMDITTFTTLLHLSVFAGWVVPFGGLVLPLIMWLTNKDKNPTVDLHGRIVMNWMISFVLYLIAAIALCFLVVGIPIVIALPIVSIIFTIIGAVKANQGIAWPYPMSISFFQVYED